MQFVSEKKGELNNKAKDAVTLHCHSSMSFINVLYCILLLFVSTLQESMFIDVMIVSLTVMLVLLQILVLMFGDKRIPSLSSIQTLFYIFIFMVIISIGLSFIISKLLSEIPDYLVGCCIYISAVLPYLSFLVYAIIILTRLKPVEKSCAEYMEKAEKMKEDIMKEYEDVRAVNTMATKLTSIKPMDDK